MSLSEFTSYLSSTMPLNILVVWTCALLLVDLFIPKSRKGITALLAALGLIISMILVIGQMGNEYVAYGGMIVVDGYSQYLSILVLGSGVLAIALSYDYLDRRELQRGEYYVLMLFSIVGVLLMAMASDLIVVFLALELLSFPLYVLAGFARPKVDSEEAAIKYFLLGAFASGFVVYGIALIFGATGTTSLAEIITSISNASANLTLLAIGAGLILVGLGFKIAAVPFHMWTPDVYQGAPSSVTAFMAVGAKVGGFAALLRIFITAFPSLSESFTPILWVLAVLTMILGNVVAISQTNIKRMLAYSSIAQAGYILMAFVPYGNPQVSTDSVASALFYLMAYAFTSFAAWAVVVSLEKAEGKGLQISDYAGIGRKYPLHAAVMTIAMLSFIGVPPTLGFVGKFYLFRTVIEGGYIGLAVIGVLTSLVSAYYYLRVVVMMYMREGEPEVRRELWLNLTAIVAAIGIILLGIFSVPLFNWASQALMMTF